MHGPPIIFHRLLSGIFCVCYIYRIGVVCFLTFCHVFTLFSYEVREREKDGKNSKQQTT